VVDGRHVIDGEGAAASASAAATSCSPQGYPVGHRCGRVVSPAGGRRKICPPTCGCSSTTMTRSPWRLASCAAARPAGPAPTTARSHTSAVIGAPHVLVGHGGGEARPDAFAVDLDDALEAGAHVAERGSRSTVRVRAEGVDPCGEHCGGERLAGECGHLD